MTEPHTLPSVDPPLDQIVDDPSQQGSGNVESSPSIPAPESTAIPAPANQQQPSHVHWQQQTQAYMGQPYSGYPYQWMPYPWYPGPIPDTSSSGYQSTMRTNGGPPTSDGANHTNGSEQTGGSIGQDRGTHSPSTFNHAGGPFFSNPGFFQHPFLATSGRPEPGDPLYTTNADGPELKIISQ